MDGVTSADRILKMAYNLRQYFVKHGTHAGADGHDHHDESTVWPKIAAMAVLGLCSFLFTMVPMLMKLRNKKRTFKDYNERMRAKKMEDRAISLLMSFAGGVLFCTIFIHVLPEVEEVFEIEIEKLGNRDLALLPQLLMCAGFFMMYLIEETTHYLMHFCGSKDAPAGNNDNNNRTASYKQGSIEHRISVSSRTVFIDDVMDKIDERATNLTLEERQKLVDTIRKAIESSPACPCDRAGQEVSGNPVRDVEIQGSCGDHGHQHHDHNHLDLTGSSAVRSFLFALALSVHELFEGLTIGLQDTPGDVWYMLFGVGAHKLVLAFCMGIEMVAGNISGCLFVTYGLMFALVSPVGIAGGILLSAGEGIVAAVFQSLASGTLLYVLFFEIFRRESHTSGFLSCLIVIFGFLLMFALHFVELE